MKNLIFVLILLYCNTLLFAQVNFELNFSFESINPEDELTNIQLFDYDDDGIDEILGSFNNQDYYRIVCYSQNGDTLNTHTQQLNNDESLGNSYAFYGHNNEKMLILVFHEYYGNGFTIKLFNYETFSMIDSVAYDIGDYYHVIEINNIIAPNINDGNIFYIGIDRFDFGYEEVTNTITYKFDYSNEQIEFLEEIYDYGLHYIEFAANDFIIAFGEYVAGGIGAWPYINTSYYLGLLSNDFISIIQSVFSTSGSIIWSNPAEYNHYPTNYKLISLNDDNYMNYGTIIYYRSTDSITGVNNHYKCYEVDFSNLLWERNDSFISSSYISTSTCISVNNEDHYVMYFRGNQLEIRNRLNGDIIHHQNSTISPFKIKRNSDNELFFFVEQEDETGYDVYVLEEEIQVSADENELPNVNYELQNYPNPFNPLTTITFSLNTENIEDYKIMIFNLKGQKVKEFDVFLSGDERESNSIVWHGTDQNNNLVSSRIYFYQLKVNEEIKQTKKMLLMK